MGLVWRPNCRSCALVLKGCLRDGASTRPSLHNNAQPQSYSRYFSAATTVVFRQMGADGFFLKPRRRATASSCPGRQNCSPNRRSTWPPTAFRIRRVLPRAYQHPQSPFDGPLITYANLEPTSEAVGLATGEPHTGQRQGPGITALLVAHHISTCSVWVQRLGYFPCWIESNAELRGI